MEAREVELEEYVPSILRNIWPRYRCEAEGLYMRQIGRDTMGILSDERSSFLGAEMVKLVFDVEGLDSMGECCPLDVNQGEKSVEFMIFVNEYEVREE